MIWLRFFHGTTECDSVRANVTFDDDAVNRRWYDLHASTYVLLTTVAFPLVLIAVPGQLVNCVRDAFDSYGTHAYAHGWPGIFLKREVGYELADDQFSIDPEAAAWLHARCWQFSRDGTVLSWNFYPAMLVADASCLICMIVLIAALVEWRRRRRPHFWHFSLAEMLMGVVLCAAAFSSWCWQRDRHADVMRLARQIEGGGAYFELGYVGPAWLGRLVGTGLFEDYKEPVGVRLGRNPGDAIRELARHHESFAHLRKFDISESGEINSAFIDTLGQMRGVQALCFFACKIDDDAISRIGAMPALEEVWLMSCRGMSNAALATLRANARHRKVIILFSDPLPQ